MSQPIPDTPRRPLAGDDRYRPRPIDDQEHRVAVMIAGAAQMIYRQRAILPGHHHLATMLSEFAGLADAVTWVGGDQRDVAMRAQRHLTAIGQLLEEMFPAYVKEQRESS